MYSGQVKFPQPDGTFKLEPNRVFHATLKFVRKVPDKPRYELTAEDGAVFSLMRTEFQHAWKTAGYKPLKSSQAARQAAGSKISGLWEFVKRGDTFGLKLVSLVADQQGVSISSKPVQAPTQPAPVEPSQVLKNRFTICIDRSASMSSIRREAVVHAVNAVLDTVKAKARETKQHTTVSIWEFGGTVQRTVEDVDVTSLPPYTVERYQPTGHNTPLFGCIGRALEAERKFEDDSTSHFIYAITDGEENASSYPYDVKTTNDAIKAVQATDRYTIAIQMPERLVETFARQYAVPTGNLQGWDLSDQGIKAAATTTSTGVGSYFTARKSGKKSITNVYSISLAGLKVEDVRAKCKLVTGVKVWKVDRETPVREFVEHHTHAPYVVGSAWYQITKPEVVQSYKTLMIRYRPTKEIFGGGDAVKTLLGIDPSNKSTFKVVPQNFNDFDVFCSSTSVNRALVRGTDVIFDASASPLPETWDSAAAKAHADAKAASK